MKIGIIYIITGLYCKFWKEFYESMECFFCTDAEKGYEVFTDSPEMLALRYPNVCFHRIADRGWVENVSSKSQCICDMKDSLIKYDYLFYLNGNYKVFSEIRSEEIVPSSSDGWLTALSYQHYDNIPPDNYPYDRNPSCQAYISYGAGEYYYQGGFYGGRTKEMILMADYCSKQIREDLDKGIVARFHDESYINKYLLKHSPKRLNEEYAYQQIWKYQGTYRAVFLDKKEYLGESTMNAIKGAPPEGFDLKRIANNMILHGSSVHNLGLFHGKMGICIFFYHYARYTQNDLYEQFAGDFLDEICEDIHDGLPIQMASGLCGIGWGIEYLLRNHFIEGEDGEILEEIDKRVMERDIRKLRDVSLDTGLRGILCYILGRISISPNKCSWYTKHESYIRELEAACISLIKDKSCIYFNTLQTYIKKGEIDSSYEIYLLKKITSYSDNSKKNQSWQNGLKLILNEAHLFNK